VVLDHPVQLSEVPRVNPGRHPRSGEPLCRPGDALIVAATQRLATGPTLAAWRSCS
jgi:hypothetical protein